MMAVSLGSSSNLASTSTAMPSPPNPPPRSSSLSPATGAGGGSSAGASASSGRSRSSRRGGSHSHREVKFGNYILGQTLGEGEFGKVKLGWRRPEPGQVSGDGVQVAIKLIRKESVDTKTRMNKIDREISILRRVHHPNIVKLCDVIYTDRHIGIILEYASGGELFDYILSHRYLKDHVACKLFAQLISGVSYLHEKGIVHRDLKLENLLLDQNRNIIITDFGFANTFNVEELGEDHDNIIAPPDNRRTGDLMQTSCGSPCYAAPELVVTDGLYAGRKVDVWSCGVILYAMLAGYLPFDDDPANPEGDNINLLYKYICTTPLTFPEYVSAMARDLLRQILKPKPEQRMTLKQVKAHTWLYPHRSLFRTAITDFEAQAKESPIHLTAQPMGRSVSAHESHHASYIPPSSSHLVTHTTQKSVSPPTSPQVSKTFDPRRHTVQVEYDRPIPSIRMEEVEPAVEPAPVKKTSLKDDLEVTGLGVPPAPALVRSATTGAASPRTTVLDTVQEKSPDKASRPDAPGAQAESPTRRPTGAASVSGVARPPTARPNMPHGTKPRPTSYHPPSSGGISMTKNRSASGDRTATLLLQRRPSSASSRKVVPSPIAPISSPQNVEGEILQSTPPPQDSHTTIPMVDKPLGPPPTRTKSHKRASASISLVADKVMAFFTTTARISPPSSPERRPSGTVSAEAKQGAGVVRTNTTTRRHPFPGSAQGSTVLTRRREKSTSSKQSISRSVTETVLPNTSPTSNRTVVKNGVVPGSPDPTIDSLETGLSPKVKRSKTETQVALPVVEVYSSAQLGIDSPKMKGSKKLGDMGPDKASTGRARKVMDFFRRRARGLME